MGDPGEKIHVGKQYSLFFPWARFHPDFLRMSLSIPPDRKMADGQYVFSWRTRKSFHNPILYRAAFLLVFRVPADQMEKTVCAEKSLLSDSGSQ